MKIIKSELLKKFPNLVFGFSTKNAYNPNDKFNFNLSFSVGNNNEIVKENRNLFLKHLKINPESLSYQKQIHSEIIKIVEKPGFQGESDALITNKAQLAIGVFSADCTTIFLYDEINKVIAAIHSGWRGTTKKIVQKTILEMVNKFRTNPKNINAFIAPAISQNNYEIGEDVATYFEEKYLIPLSNKKFLLDVSLVNYDLLITSGLEKENVEFSSFCSFDETYLHSYRRDKNFSGRAMGILMMRN